MSSTTAKYDENYNYCIYRNGELIFISHADLGKMHFNRKMQELKERGIHVEDMR